MATSTALQFSGGKYLGLNVTLTGVGKAETTRLLHQNSDTSIYATSTPGIVLKTFDLDCGKPDEVSYGPYLSFQVEVENFSDIQQVEQLRVRVPAYYGSNLDSQRKFAYIAMEYLEGENLLAWSQSAAAQGYPSEWVEQFRAAVYESLSIVRMFHEHGIILIDFKPDNVIRLYNGAIKFVDLGAFFTPRHGRETDNYVYSATPDYAELVIDTSNVQTGLPLTQGSDIFSAGVALFELATGGSRLCISPDTANQMLSQPSLFRFRDSQIRDVWKAFPHLKELLPLVQTQLQQRRILFSEFWHLLKSFLSLEVPQWESMPEIEHQEMLLCTGISFISDQLPEGLKWLAQPIARSTTLRSFRLKSVVELMELIADPISEAIREDINHYNVLVQVGRDLDPPLDLTQSLNSWEVKLNPHTQHWAISCRRAAADFRGMSEVTFLKLLSPKDQRQRFFQVVGDLEADIVEGQHLTLAHLAADYAAWAGA